MGILEIIALVSAVMTNLPALIRAAESIYGAIRGRGSVKKEYVQQSVQASLDVMAALGNDTAAKPEVQKAVLAASGVAIDGIVASMNAVNAWKDPAPAGGPDTR